MQVILLKDVPKLGQQYEVKNVSDGFALNLLFPKGLAEMASTERVAALEARRVAVTKLRDSEGKALEDALNKLSGRIISFKAGKANEKGSLYQGIDIGSISDAIGREVGARIPQNLFVLPAPIKTIGEHKITIAKGDKKFECTLLVEAEK